MLLLSYTSYMGSLSAPALASLAWEELLGCQVACDRGKRHPYILACSLCGVCVRGNAFGSLLLSRWTSDSQRSGVGAKDNIPWDMSVQWPFLPSLLETNTAMSSFSMRKWQPDPAGLQRNRAVTQTTCTYSFAGSWHGTNEVRGLLENFARVDHFLMCKKPHCA